VELVPTPIQSCMSFSGTLQDALWEVINQERFAEMSFAEIVGTLEYLKWNIINRSDR